MEQFYANNTEIGDTGVQEALRHWPGLTHLYLKLAAITNTAFAALVPAKTPPPLSDITLSHTQVSAEGFRHLVQYAKNLNHVDAKFTQLDDSVVPLIHEYLSNIEFLNIKKTQLTEDGKAILLDMMPSAVMTGFSAAAVIFSPRAKGFFWGGSIPPPENNH